MHVIGASSVRGHAKLLAGFTSAALLILGLAWAYRTAKIPWHLPSMPAPLPIIESVPAVTFSQPQPVPAVESVPPEPVQLRDLIPATEGFPTTSATELLQMAVAHAALGPVQALIQVGADPAVPDEQGKLPLVVAVRAGAHPMVSALLQAGAAPMARDTDGLSALEVAIRRTDIQTLQLLLQHGATLVEPLADGSSPIDAAIASHSRPLLEAVLEAAPATLNWSDRTRDALFTAIRARDERIAKLLLTKHPRPATVVPGSQPLLAYLVAWGEPAQLDFFLKCGANPNATLSSPDDARFLALLSGKMLPHYVTEEPGMTPLMLAAGLGRTDLVQVLLQHKAERGRVTQKYKLAALNFAAWAKAPDAILLLMGKDPAVARRSHIDISLTAQHAFFYKDGKIEWSAPVSTGKTGFDTPTGEYVITDKHRSHYSTIYKVAMPYFMRLSCAAFGLHEGYVPPYAASHGCIRVPRDNVQKLYQLADVGTVVKISP